MIYWMARERDEDSKDVKAGTTNGKLVTDRKEMLQVWEEYFNTLMNQWEKREIDLPSAVEGELRMEEIGDGEIERDGQRESSEEGRQALMTCEWRCWR